MTMFELVARCPWCWDGRSFEAFNWEGTEGGVPSVRTRRRCGLSIAMFPLVRFLLDGKYSVMQKFYTSCVSQSNESGSLLPPEAARRKKDGLNQRTCASGRLGQECRTWKSLAAQNPAPAAAATPHTRSTFHTPLTPRRMVMTRPTRGQRRASPVLDAKRRGTGAAHPAPCQRAGRATEPGDGPGRRHGEL